MDEFVKWKLEEWDLSFLGDLFEGEILVHEHIDIIFVINNDERLLALLGYCEMA